MLRNRVRYLFRLLSKKYLTLLVVVFILILGNRLRTYSYASVPNPGETADEYSFGWLGISLLKERYPIAWSGIPAYKNHDFQKVNVDGIYDQNKDPNRPEFAIDKPWFDHPPLFGLVTGGYAYLKGVREFADASVIILRRPMLKIALITTGLIFILGKIVYNIRTGILASFLYSIIPTTVISSRLALAENGYVPLYILSVIFAVLYFKKKMKRYWLAACFIAGLALLMKLSSLSITLTLLLLSIKFIKRERTFTLKYLVISLTLFIGIFLLYGLFFDWNTFTRVLGYNAQRFYGSGSEIFFNALTKSSITKYLTDGWVLLGWISFFMLSWRQKKEDLVPITALVSSLIIFLFFGSEAYGWYRIPFYPFLVISLARVILILYRRSNLILASLLLLLPLGTAVHKLIGLEGFQNYVPAFRLFIAVFTSGAILSGLFRTKKLAVIKRVLIVAVFTFAVLLSVEEVYYFDLNNWYFAT